MITSLTRVEQMHIGEDNTENTNQMPGIAQELQILKKNNAAIINQIEILRQHLEKLILNNNFTDPEVLATSQALDEALNKFQRTQSSINDNP